MSIPNDFIVRLGQMVTKAGHIAQLPGAPLVGYGPALAWSWMWAIYRRGYVKQLTVSARLLTDASHVELQVEAVAYPEEERLRCCDHPDRTLAYITPLPELDSEQSHHWLTETMQQLWDSLGEK